MTAIKAAITGLGLVGLLGCSEKNITKASPQEQVKAKYESATKLTLGYWKTLWSPQLDSAEEHITFANDIANARNIDPIPYAETLVENVYQSATEIIKEAHVDTLIGSAGRKVELANMTARKVGIDPTPYLKEFVDILDERATYHEDVGGFASLYTTNNSIARKERDLIRELERDNLFFDICKWPELENFEIGSPARLERELQFYQCIELNN